MHLNSAGVFPVCLNVYLNQDNTVALDGQKDSLVHVIWSVCYCCRHSLTAVWWL